MRNSICPFCASCTGEAKRVAPTSSVALRNVLRKLQMKADQRECERTARESEAARNRGAAAARRELAERTAQLRSRG